MGSAADRGDRDFGGVRVSTLDWPILLVEFPENKVSDAAVHSVLGYLESLMGEAAKNRERVFILTDISLMREVTPASQRRYTGEWIRRVDPLASVATVGGATITPSPILRGIMTAVYWISQPPTKTNFAVATRQQGMLKGIQLLEREGVPLSPRLATYRDRHSASRAV